MACRQAEVGRLVSSAKNASACFLLVRLPSLLSRSPVASGAQETRGRGRFVEVIGCGEKVAVLYPCAFQRTI